MFLLESSQPNTREERRSARLAIAERYPDDPELAKEMIEALGLLPEDDPR